MGDTTEFSELDEEGRDRLNRMADEMKSRGLPPSVVAAGIRSTARLLLEHGHANRHRIEHSDVRDFIEANHGTPVSRARRAEPRRESKVIARERLLERLRALVSTARSTRRKHEVLRLRREILALDQAHIRRVLGDEGAALCSQMNDWLAEAAAGLH